ANIYLGSERTPTIRLVMTDTLDDILLGMNFLDGVGATLLCGGQTLRLHPSDNTKPPWDAGTRNAPARTEEPRSDQRKE
ncbi:hypothetical protein KR054_001465, partial [Drosophila jambulina]